MVIILNFILTLIIFIVNTSESIYDMWCVNTFNLNYSDLTNASRKNKWDNESGGNREETPGKIVEVVCACDERSTS